MKTGWTGGGGVTWQRVTSDHVATLVTIKASLKNKILPLGLRRPVRGDGRPAGADVGLHFLLCPPTPTTPPPPPRSLISIPFLLLGFPLQIGLHHREKASGRPRRSGEGSPEARARPPAVVPERASIWVGGRVGGGHRGLKKPQSRLISLKVQ